MYDSVCTDDECYGVYVIWCKISDVVCTKNKWYVPKMSGMVYTKDKGRDVYQKLVLPKGDMVYTSDEWCVH